MVATVFSTQMAGLVADAGGAIEALPGVNQVGGKERVVVANITLAGNAVGVIVGVARLPMYAALLGITAVTDTSLGSAQISFGDTNNATLYGAAQTLTSVATPTAFVNAATLGQPIVTGYDCTTGNQVTYAKPGQAGALYEDVIMSVSTAGLPANGNLVVLIRYMID